MTGPNGKAAPGQGGPHSVANQFGHHDTGLDGYGAVRHSDPSTSVAAATADTPIRRFRRGVALSILARLIEAGDRGMTTDEVLAHRPHDDRATIARRITDLRQAGYVADSGRRRRSDRGCWSTVWIARRPEGLVPAVVHAPPPELADAVAVAR